MKRIALAVALTGFVSATGTAMAEDIGEADAVIKYRKAAMSAVGGHVGGLVAILKGDISDRSALATHAAGLSHATNAAMFKAAFGQNTAGKGSAETTATAKIWEDWAGFEEQLMKLETTAAEVATMAAAGTLTEFDQLKPMLGTCGACHRKLGYRQK